MIRILAFTLLLIPATVFAAGKLHHVEINGVKFIPDALEIHPGDTVIWENKDIVPHTVTAEDNAFNSGQLNTGAKFKRTFKQAGEVKYKCLFHPVMAGKVEVIFTETR